MQAEPEIREVEDARLAQRVAKHRNARWVAGLTPEDDLPVATLGEFESSSENETFPRAGWLRAHGLYFLLAAYLTCPYAPSTSANDPFLSFPVSEGSALRLLENSSHWAIASAAAINAVIAVSVARFSFDVACASQSFANFLGFAVAVVSLMAVIGEVVLLEGACWWRGNPEHCFLPFVLHWLVAWSARFGPVLAVSLNLIGLCTVKPLRWRYGLPVLAALSLVPFAVFLRAWGHGWWVDEVENLCETTRWLCSVFPAVYGALALLCFQLPPFRAVEKAKTKRD